jgi:hypothetical protein
MKRYIPGWLTLLLSVALESSYADVISTDLNTTGDGLLTTDIGTGFEWLDLSQTLGLSYDDVSSRLGTGEQFEGFRYGTRDEVADLYRAAGIVDLSGACVYANANGVAELFSLMGGLVSLGVDRTLSFGVTGTPSGTTTYYRGSLAYRIELAYPVPNYTGSAYLNSSVSEGSSASYLGHYLLREPNAVPEPSTFAALAGVSTLGLIFVRRRRKR